MELLLLLAPWSLGSHTACSRLQTRTHCVSARLLFLFFLSSLVNLAAVSSSVIPAGAGATRRTRRAQYAWSASTSARSFSETSQNCRCRKRRSNGSSSSATFPADFRGRARKEPALKQRMCAAACSAPTRMTPTCAPTASIHTACTRPPKQFLLADVLPGVASSPGAVRLGADL